MKDAVVPHQIRKVFEGRVFSVLIESITTRKGGKMDVEIVRHPGSVVLIPLNARGEVILVRQYRHAIGRSAWELPAGTLKPNDDTAQNPSYAFAAGGVISTADDLAIWMRALAGLAGSTAKCSRPSTRS